MNSNRKPSILPLAIVLISATLVLAAHVSAENSTTIDQSTQPHLKSWSNVIPNAARRFVVLPDFNNEAVLDRETGLVWERTPEGSTRIWEDAIRTCWLRQVGGRAGWHLPTIEELGSLVDPTIPAPGPALPLGHPFQNVQPGAYWSSTSDVRVEFVPNQAWEVRFNIPFGSSGILGDKGKSSLNFVWCSRGGTHADKYK
jgi:hypothetical protein